MSYVLYNSLLLFRSLKGVILYLYLRTSWGKKFQRYQEYPQAENYSEGLVSYFYSSGASCVIIIYRQTTVWRDCVDDLQH